MNLRVLILIGLILLFAAVFGALSYIHQQGMTLEDAYREGKVTITQITPAGTVPHRILIVSNSERPIRVEEGTILNSAESENLVIARDEIIPPKNNSTLQAYCIEPEKSAVKGSQFNVSGKVPWMMRKILRSSNPSNPSDAFNTQLKIWVLARGANLNIYTGEAYYTTIANDMDFYELKNNISVARIEIMTAFNLTEEQMNSINMNSTLLKKGESLWDKIMEILGLD